MAVQGRRLSGERRQTSSGGGELQELRGVRRLQQPAPAPQPARGAPATSRMARAATSRPGRPARPAAPAAPAPAVMAGGGAIGGGPDRGGGALPGLGVWPGTWARWAGWRGCPGTRSGCGVHGASAGAGRARWRGRPPDVVALHSSRRPAARPALRAHPATARALQPPTASGWAAPARPRAPRPPAAPPDSSRARGCGAQAAPGPPR